jgi:hypothetical protein
MVQIVSFPFNGYDDWHEAGLRATGKTFQILTGSWDEYVSTNTPKEDVPELVFCDYSALRHTADYAATQSSVAFLRDVPIVLGGDAEDIVPNLMREERKLNIVAIVPCKAQFEPSTFVTLSNAFDVAKKGGSVTAQTFGEALKTIRPTTLPERPTFAPSAWAYIPHKDSECWLRP